MLPFEEIETPSFSMRMTWTLDQLSAYLRTWSAVKRHVVETGKDPVDALESKLDSHWGAGKLARLVKMPLYLRASRKPA
jgi:hypothetical protein